MLVLLPLLMPKELEFHPAQRNVCGLLTCRSQTWGLALTSPGSSSMRKQKRSWTILHLVRSHAIKQSQYRLRLQPRLWSEWKKTKHLVCFQPRVKRNRRQYPRTPSLSLLFPRLTWQQYLPLVLPRLWLHHTPLSFQSRAKHLVEAS